MPMGIVSDSDFESEVGKLNPSVPSEDNGKPVAIIKETEKGRGNGNKNVPEGLRKLIGEEAAINGKNSGLQLATNFGISTSSVSAYEHGSRSTATYNRQPDLDKLNEAKLRVSKRARNRLLIALNHITAEKIQDAKVKDISSVAKDMSIVMKNMEPEAPRLNGNGSGPTFIFYSPQVRKEEVFDIVQVKE